tara:strand:- start:2876 stop:3880 length:1005 start_codon:yes stop_codon:yes gene_type:complete
MKEIIISLIASFMLCAFAYSQDREKPQTGGSDPRQIQKPGVGGEKPEVGRPAPRPVFPLHWGRPPEIELKDHVKLPGNFGMGSSTLANWIKGNIEEDRANGRGPGEQGKPEKPEVLTEKEKLDPRKFEADVLKGVKEGTVSREEAKKKLDALRGEMEKRGEFKRPKRPTKPELSDDVKAKLDDIKSQQDSIAKEMKTKLDALKQEGASKEQMREAIHAFQKDNKDRLEAIKSAHKDIHESLKGARPPKPERPELTAEIKVKVEALKEKQKELHTARKDLHENLKDKSKEERETLIVDFKEANKAKHEEIKTKAKEVKEEIRALVETEATRTSDL